VIGRERKGRRAVFIARVYIRSLSQKTCDGALIVSAGGLDESVA